MPWVAFSKGRRGSRHSGESSLSPKEPRSSEMRMSMGIAGEAEVFGGGLNGSWGVGV